MNFIPQTLAQLGIVGSDHECAEIVVSHIAIDSRRVVAGTLFIARDGVNHKGHDFLIAAEQNGACAAVIEATVCDPYLPEALSIPVIRVENLAKLTGQWVSQMLNHPSQRLKVVAITGTNGKTSCAHFAAQMLTQMGVRTAVLGTVGNGFLEQLRTASHTTPDVISLHCALAEFVSQGAEAVVMEASSHALDQYRVAGVDFDAVAFTNLSRDHLDYHGTMAAYGAAKARLFLEYGAAVNIVNVDDDYGAELYTLLRQQGVSVHSVGEQSQADYYINSVELSTSGMQLTLATEQHATLINAPIIGRFNVANVSLVIALLLEMGFTETQVMQAAQHLYAVPGRMELMTNADQPAVVVDYAHTPDALAKALQACRYHCPGRLWVVFGCGGDRDTGKRAEMAAAAETLADHIVVTSDNPRSEEPNVIIDMVFGGFAQTEHVIREVDRAQAIQYAIEQATLDDFVLIAGKGHESYQEVAGIKHDFSDQAIVKAQLFGVYTS